MMLVAGDQFQQRDPVSRSPNKDSFRLRFLTFINSATECKAFPKDSDIK